MARKGPAGEWYKNSKNIRGLLLDISGVLYDSGEGGGVAIKGSIEAVKRLKSSGVPVRFCTNESQLPKDDIASKLSRLGFDMAACEVFPPAPAVCTILKQRNLRPHLLIHKEVYPEFKDIDQTNPNCVVLGDAADGFSYENVNKAFNALMNMDNPVLLSMGQGKYYKETDGLKLDVGAYMKLLEFTCDVKAEVVGKPSKSFFQSALKDMGLTPDECVMIGDDIVNDIGGAQACGMKGVQVRTGKFRPEDEPHPTVTPDGYVDNLLQAVELYLEHR